VTERISQPQFTTRSYTTKMSVTSIVKKSKKTRTDTSAGDTDLPATTQTVTQTQHRYIIPVPPVTIPYIPSDLRYRRMSCDVPSLVGSSRTFQVVGGRRLVADNRKTGRQSRVGDRPNYAPICGRL